MVLGFWFLFFSLLPLPSLGSTVFPEHFLCAVHSVLFNPMLLFHSTPSFPKGPPAVQHFPLLSACREHPYSYGPSSYCPAYRYSYLVAASVLVLALAPQRRLSCCIFPQLPFRIPPPLVILICIPLPLLLLTLLALQAQLPVQLILLLPLKLLLLLQLSLLMLCPISTPAAALVQFLLFLCLFLTSCAAGSAKLLPPRSC